MTSALRDALPSLPVSIEARPWRWLLADARITRTTSEEFIPQMLDLDLLDAISFKKGCYIGQEIVSRTHYLGPSKRRMHHLLSENGQLKIGAAVDEESKPILSAGMVVRAIDSRQSGQKILAVLASDAVDGGASLLGSDPNGPKLRVLPLPYQIS